MTKMEAAQILADYTQARARKCAVTLVTPLWIQTCMSEAPHAGGLITEAAAVGPSWRTIRTIGRRMNRSN